MRFDVTYEDGSTATVEPGPADVLAFEREHKTTMGEAIRSGSPLWSIYITWHKLHRRGESRSFDVWLDQVSKIVSPDDEAADPTAVDARAGETSAPTDSLPPSPSEPDNDTATS